MATRRYNALNRGQVSMGGSDVSHSSDVKLLNFLIAEYGSTEFALEIADKLLSLARNFKKDSRRFQRLISFLRLGIPATILTAELLNKIEKFRKLKAGELSVYNEKEYRVAKLIGDGSKHNGGFNYYPFPIGKDIFGWLMTDPQTKSFKVLGYYNQADLIKISRLSDSEQRSIYALIEFKGVRLVWDINVSSYDSNMVVRDSSIHGRFLESGTVTELRMCFFKEFVNHFNVKENVIYIHSSGIYHYPRKVIPEDPIQFDVAPFQKEMLKVLSKGKKRAAVFVGVPGVGKSTVIKKLEGTITEYPFIYCTPDCFCSSWAIQETFSLIQHIQPCIVVMEDMDSYDFRDKKKDLGVFLDEMDDVNGKLKVFIIATINDTSLVHYSLINRPGRFDQVYKLDTPRNAEEVYQVMKTRYEKNKSIDECITKEFLVTEKIDPNFFKRAIENKFTHADICEIVEKALLIDYNAPMEILWEGLKSLESSKAAISSCNFSGRDPRSTESYDAIDLVPSSAQLNSEDLNFKANGR